MYRLFEKMILGEAAPPAAPPQQQQQGDPNDPSSMVQQPPPPPDFTGDPAGTGSQPDTTDPNGGAAPPQMPPGAPGGGGLDPSMGGAMPDQAAAGGDPNAMSGDPNDPNAQMDPNAQDPNADPNAMGGDPNAAMGADQGIQGPEAEIDQAEKDVFSDLKPEQMLIKNTELKERYQEVYKAATDSLEKINKISRTTYDDNMLDFIVKKLTNLKSMVVDALENSFPTRTYADNKTELQRFIVGYNFLTNLMTQIYESRLKRQQKVMELNKKVDSVRDPEEFPVFTRGYDIQ